jgi:molybdopterin synthase sulfur carrier subunit
MALVKLFGGLGRLTGGTAVDAPGGTVVAVLDYLCTAYPELETAVLDGGQLLPHVRVMVNGLDIELGAGIDTAVGENDTMAIFPPIAGG